MSGRSGRGGRQHNKRHSDVSSTAPETATSLAADSPVFALFRATALYLNAKHDRHERLVKLSRDITIESKRVIFLLHSAIRKEDVEKTVVEANDRLNKLVNTSIRAIALELEDSPKYLHSRAISPGLQEFIEAKTLCHLMQHGTFITCSEVQKEFTFSIKSDKDKGEAGEEKVVETLLPPLDFVLGLADLTGELMRRTINSLSSGHSDESIRSCQLVRDLYAGFLSIFSGGKQVKSKMNTMRANVSKVEGAVYALHVRGREAPPALLLPGPAALSEAPPRADNLQSDDEGYY